MRAVSLRGRQGDSSFGYPWSIDLYRVKFDPKDGTAYWDHWFCIAYLVGDKDPRHPPVWIQERAKAHALAYGVPFIHGLLENSTKGLGPIELLAMQVMGVA